MPKKTSKKGSNKASKPKLAFGAKSAFVRARPKQTVPELVKLAAEAGIELTPNHIYNIRSADKTAGRVPDPKAVAEAEAATKAKAEGAATGGAEAAPSAAMPPPTVAKSPAMPLAPPAFSVMPQATLDGDLAAQFRILVGRLGLDQAERLFTEVRETLSFPPSPARKAAAPRSAHRG